MKNLLLSLSILLNFSLFFVACGSKYLIPEWKPNLYAGNNIEMAIVRRQANQSISCSDPLFTDYICMSSSDFISIKTDIIDKCEKWKPGTKLVDPLTSKNKDNVKIVMKSLK